MSGVAVQNIYPLLLEKSPKKSHVLSINEVWYQPFEERNEMIPMICIDARSYMIF